VLIIVGSLGPGGAERQVAYTAVGLAKRGFDVIVGCNSLEPPNDMFRSMLEGEGVTILECPREEPSLFVEGAELYSRFEKYAELNFWNIFHAVYNYSALIASIKPQIVHTWTDYANVLGGLAAAIVGVPKVVLSGRSAAPDNFPNLFQPYMRPGYELLFERRDPIVLNNSRFGAMDYARFLGVETSRIQVVNNGFVFPGEISKEIRKSVRREYGIPDDAFVVGTITRFSEEKQPRLFADLARDVLRRCRGVYFLGFGIGPQLAEIRSEVAAAGLSEFVKLPGLTDDAWGSLSAMDMFILTSRMEGLANVLIEAQGSGLPVVCTGVGGMPETYLEGETGFGVKDARPEMLADAVCLLIKDPIMRQRMSDAARRHAREFFSVEKMIARTVEVYEAAENRIPSARGNTRCEPLPQQIEVPARSS
ncbi:MAG: glycosyltransferase, partial [Chloroflexota bacterium]